MGFESSIEGVIVKPLKRFSDDRGWLTELFRDDELPEGFEPVMGYISFTHPGISRGPHEHREQADGFCFVDGEYEVLLWENRPGKPKRHERFHVGSAEPVFVVVPPGVVHAYRNIGDRDAFVLNFANQLYAGWGRKEPVDEIRHEEMDSEFKI